MDDYDRKKWNENPEGEEPYLTLQSRVPRQTAAFHLYKPPRTRPSDSKIYWGAHNTKHDFRCPLSSIPKNLEHQLDIRPAHFLEISSFGDRVEIAQDEVEAFFSQRLIRKADRQAHRQTQREKERQESHSVLCILILWSFSAYLIVSWTGF